MADSVSVTFGDPSLIRAKNLSIGQYGLVVEFPYNHNLVGTVVRRIYGNFLMRVECGYVWPSDDIKDCMIVRPLPAGTRIDIVVADKANAF